METTDSFLHIKLNKINDNDVNYISNQLPYGLEICKTPLHIYKKTWYFEDDHGKFRGAIMPLILIHKFPKANWFICGDDDTMFSPLALAQWLRNYNFNEPWYTYYFLSFAFVVWPAVACCYCLCLIERNLFLSVCAVFICIYPPLLHSCLSLGISQVVLR